MRTCEAIRHRVEEIGDRDPFGFEREDLLSTLPKEELPPEIAANAPAGYKPDGADREAVLSRMRDYMDFAIEKARDHRGLSALRSISHFKAWIWLLGDEDYEAMSWDRHGPYGVPILKQICERYGFEHEFAGILARMAEGKPCTDGCNNGCTS